MILLDLVTRDISLNAKTTSSDSAAAIQIALKGNHVNMTTSPREDGKTDTDLFVGWPLLPWRYLQSQNPSLEFPCKIPADSPTAKTAYWHASVTFLYETCVSARANPIKATDSIPPCCR